MTYIQRLRGDFQITDPNWPVYKPLSILTSDSFSGTGPLVGSATDTAFGGTPTTWHGPPAGGWTRGHNGDIVPPQDDYFKDIHLRGLPADVAVSAIATHINTGQIIFSVRASGDRRQRTRANFLSTGVIRLDQFVDGVRQVGPEIPHDYTVGDRIGIETKGAKSAATVNGEKVVEWDTAVTGPGDLVLTSYPIADYRIDDLIVAEV